MKIGVVGASGRTGSRVVEAVTGSNDCSLNAALVSAHSSRLGQAVPGAPSGVVYSADLKELSKCDGVIDFSLPAASMEAARVCSTFGIPILIATTGHTPAEKTELVSLARTMACLVASNTSLGAAVLGILAEQAQRLLGADYDIEVSEIHHKMKRDAPSGTAATLVEGMTAKGYKRIFGREGLRASDEIGVVSLRGGDVPGDHTVHFFGIGERIELTHRVHDRRVFAQGAVALLKRLVGRLPGLYTVRNVLEP